MQRRMLKLAATTLVVMVALLAVLFWLTFVRPWKERWTETIQFLDGTSTQVAMEHSSKPYWGIQHAGGIGGGDDHYRVEVQAGGIRYKWSGGDEHPFVFGLRDGKLFMAVLDRSDLGHVRFRYYRSDSANQLQEISLTDFPKELAVQNVWLTPDEATTLRKMDPEDFACQRSLTAHLWLHLEKGVDYDDQSDPSSPFLTEYESMYIKVKLASSPAVGTKP